MGHNHRARWRHAGAIKGPMAPLWQRLAWPEEARPKEPLVSALPT
jgi:hypothetical protein